MILLYIIGILCSLVLFAPSIVPAYVKWPIAMLVVLLIVFFFNLPKKDTIYTTKDNKKRLHDYGLFNPLLLYLSAICYILGFSSIFTALAGHEAVDIVANLSKIFSFASADLNYSLLFGLIFIVLAIFFYYIRHAYRKSSSSSSLKTRAFGYIILTLAALGAGVYNILNFYTYDIYEDLLVGYNLFIYFGIVGLILLIDSISAICIASKHKKREDLEFAVRCHFGLKEDEEITKAHISEYKKYKLIEDERITTEKHLSKQEKKLHKKLAKVNAKLAKKVKKFNK